MRCQRCNSDRILELCIKDHGEFSASFKGVHITDTSDLEGIYSGGYTDPSICLECGQVQGTFPIADPECNDDGANDSTPTHSDAVMMLDSIMSKGYKHILAADDPGHLFVGFSCYNTKKNGEEKDTVWYTVRVDNWLKFLKSYPNMRRFSSAHGRQLLVEQLKTGRNFLDWYSKLEGPC